MKILIVEDEAIILAYIETLLKYDFEVKKATGGAEAVKIAEVWLPDIVILDFTLADSVNGVLAAKSIALIRDIPFIFLTGKTEEEIRSVTTELKVIKVFTKPIDSEGLVKLLDEQYQNLTAQTDICK